MGAKGDIRGRSTTPRVARALVVLGLAAFFLLPWYALEDGLLGFEWLAHFPADEETGPAIWQVFGAGRWWLLPLLPLLGGAALAVFLWPRSDPRHGASLVACGALGLVYGLGQGWAIGPLGFTSPMLAALFGAFEGRQFGMGLGAAVVLLVFLLFLTEGLAARGALRGDGFATGALGVVVAGVGLFVLQPVAVVLLRALETDEGGLSARLFVENLLEPKLWALGGGRVGVVWASLILAVASGAGSTLLGLAFALAATRMRIPGRGLLRALGVLPVITPPFVIGLAVILLFGRAGLITERLEDTFGLAASRYIFGFPGVFLAQLLAFAPVALLVLIGVLEGISPALEEAAQTLRASRWRTFRTVTFPLLRPGLANAFLLGFVESLADFGNPLVLGGSWEVLSTEIYFTVAGAQSDVPRAAALSAVLLALTLGAFLLQRWWLGDRGYTTVTGKAEGGLPARLPRGLEVAVLSVVVPWTAFTLLVYASILAGGFVEVWGRDHTPTLRHFGAMFSVGDGLALTGAAWPSLLTTTWVAAAAAPLTALFGVLTAHLLARQRFRGHAAFELGTLVSFAVPGTVVGVGYILAFNTPPFELTGTALILILCFVFRNMPVGVRAAVAGLSQIDRSLDEASLTLGASGAETLRRVVIPLLRPAILAGLVYGFVRAMTAVSAVIFLVSAEHNLATTFILGRVENGEYGSAIAYSAVLVVFMAAVIAGLRWAVGRREIGRRAE